MNDQNWSMFTQDRASDLNHLILEAQGSLLVCPTPEGSPQLEYNKRLRKIISSIQDLRDELGSLSQKEQ